MAVLAEKFLNSLDTRVDEIIDACTACGACVAVCPTPGVVGLDASNPQALATGILDVLRYGAGPENSEEWARTCCGSGFCLTVCEHGINPRFMLNMARRAMTTRNIDADRKAVGKAAFQKMSRGVRVLSRLSMPPEILDRLSPHSHPERAEPADVVFYTGCNMLKTPHIGLLCLDVLEKLNLTYEVHGGPGSCCGILQTRPGDMRNAARQAFTTIDKFAKAKASQVLSWCPTCQIQFGEMMIPSYKEATGTGIDMTMFPVFLAQHIDRLRPFLTNPVNKRVAVYEYAGALGVMEGVQTLLDAIPGVEVVEMGHASIGYTSTALLPLKDYHKNSIAKGLAAAEAAEVDTLVGVYHSDHREFSGHQDAWPFDVANYMELIGESMGLARPDMFKQLKLMGDADAIVAASAGLIEQNGLDVAEAREVVLSDMLGDQALPVDRSLHPAE
ncbi:(Fe-S)-binding protein [Alphaproteobacteria bacterium]|nr:(Fe-S)-binding protein [Alphaproteobacteria bacterium]